MKIRLLIVSVLVCSLISAADHTQENMMSEFAERFHRLDMNDINLLEAVLDMKDPQVINQAYAVFGLNEQELGADHNTARRLLFEHYLVSLDHLINLQEEGLPDQLNEGFQEIIEEAWQLLNN